MRTLRTVVAVLAVAGGGLSAWANQLEKVFTKENAAKTLCHTNARGKFVVDKDELAILMVDAAKVPRQLMRTANKTGEEIRNFPDDHYRYALSSELPFGPGPYSKDEKEAADRLLDVRDDLSAFPPKLAKSEGFSFPGRVYPSTFFYDESLNIDCAKPAPSAKEGAKKSSEQKTKEGLLLRKTIDDLGADLKTAAAATVSYQVRNDARTIAADAVVGVKIADVPLPSDVFGDISLIPFVRYSAAHAGKASDTEVWEPGFLFRTYVSVPAGSFRVQAHGSRLFDTEHSAQKTDLDVSVYPSFRLGERRYLLGGPLQDTGALILTPNVLFRAAANYIDEAGTNKEFANKKSYSSYGAVPELRFSFYSELLPPYLAFLSALGGTVRYHLIENSNDVRDVRFLDFQLAYSITESANWKVTFDLKRGEDPSTLEQLNLWKVGLGVKF